MPEEAVLDAPDTGLEDSEIESGGDEGSQESSEGESSESTEKVESQDEPSIIEADGKLKLSSGALETLNKLKAENPKQAREFRAALFDAAAIKKEFPEGIREAVALKQELEEIGGMEAVGSMRGELDAWKGLDADWTGNKPNFAADMAESNPEAFSFHAPHVMAKYAEVDNPGFTHEISKVIAADMSSADIPMALNLMRREIEDPDNPGKVKPGMNGIVEIYNTMSNYLARVNKFATDKPAAKEGSKPAAQGSEVEQREQALTVREFQGDRNNVKDSITKAEFQKNVGSRKLAGDKVSTIQELYESALNRAVQATPGHKEKVDRYVAAKDRSGYRKYMDGVIRKAAGPAMAAAFRRAGVGDKPGPKLAPKPAAKPGTPATPTAGFNRVGSKPNHNEVDWQSTARIAGKKGGDGKYIMRDGSKVLFQR
jgi:hypothetical protein